MKYVKSVTKKYKSLILANMDELSLCFNKTHFNRKDFCIDRFVNLARRRVPLDSIHDDLRLYLRYLQNSMIELINDDYAEFVKLSSSLTVLKDIIFNSSNNIELCWSSFSASTFHIQKAAVASQRFFLNLILNKFTQTLIRNKIMLCLAIKNLSTILNRRSTDISTWLLKIFFSVTEVDIWINRVPKSSLTESIITRYKSCYSLIKDILIKEFLLDFISCFDKLNIIINLFILIGKVEIAITNVTKSSIFNQILMSEETEKDILLNNLFANILTLRSKWISLLESHSQLNIKTELFIDSILLQFCIKFMEDNFGSVFISSNTNLFVKCYNATLHFILNWPTLLDFFEIETLFKTLLNKFNTIVYFKMQVQELQNDLKTESKIFNLVYIDSNSKSRICRYSLSNKVLDNIILLFTDNCVFLPSLVDKFWDFSLKSLNIYLNWINFMIYNIQEYYNKTNITEIKYWINLIILSVDVTIIFEKFKNLCKNTIWKHLSDIKVTNLAPFEDCITVLNNNILRVKKDITMLLTEIILLKSSKIICSVIDIPKQYRWTKKQAPSSYSTYLQTSFLFSDNFKNECLRFGWDLNEILEIVKNVTQKLVEIFCEQAELVLDSVEQTGSSLQRFKKKLQKEEFSDTSESKTDEIKIRSQLLYDVLFVIQRADESNIDLYCLKSIENRLNKTEIKDLNSI